MEPLDLRNDECRLALEISEGAAERQVALVSGDEEGVVRGHLPGGLPDALHGHELGGVGRQPVELDAVAVFVKPEPALFGEPMAGAVVDDEEDLPTGVA